MLAARARRAASSLFAATIAVGIAVACTAGTLPTGGDPPFNPDTDGDDIDDGLLKGKCILDEDGDGKPDPFDLNGDGNPDGPGFDSDCDLEGDGIGIDSNNDGIIDTIQNTDGSEVIAPGSGGGSSIAVDGNPSTGGTPGTSEYCSEAEVEFVPQIPTVLVLVDRSSSMFDANASTDFWRSLKAAVLPVIEGLQADVRFGFASYTGTSATCSGMTAPTGFAVDNYTAIEAAYGALGDPALEPGGLNGETPTAVAIEQGAAVLLADDAPGDRYILLVSDGDPDFCNNPGPTCGADGLVASLQAAAAAGVRTLVFGIDNPDIADPAIFDFYAQAGMGEQPNWAGGLEIGPYTGKFQSECSQYPDWVHFRTLTGNDPDPETCNTPDGQNQPPEGNQDCYLPAGDYSTVGGTATAFLSTDTAALAEQISSTVSGLKSCIFDLGDSGVSVKTGEEDTGEIFVQDELIPQDQWRMNSATVLELLGESCTKWQSPEVTKFFAGFPCEALIIVVK